MTIRVLVVDDEPMVCAHLRTILGADPGLEVVAEAYDGAEAVEAALRHRPDVVLLDLRMPGADGLAALPRLAALVSPPRVVVLTTFDLDEYVLRALRGGACGFLLKSTPPDDLVELVRAAATGSTVLSPIATEKLLAGAQAHASTAEDTRRRAAALLARLTARELDIVIQIGRGHSNAEIAADLNLSMNTVKGYVYRVMGKLSCANRTQVGIVAHDAGLIPR